jgi:hypothetical protein
MANLSDVATLTTLTTLNNLNNPADLHELIDLLCERFSIVRVDLGRGKSTVYCVELGSKYIYRIKHSDAKLLVTAQKKLKENNYECFTCYDSVYRMWACGHCSNLTCLTCLLYMIYQGIAAGKINCPFCRHVFYVGGYKDAQSTLSAWLADIMNREEIDEQLSLLVKKRPDVLI